MALGSALLFNIQLTDNFNRPYLATSVAEFWRRWHITFSRWILDYIFKPLQMRWRNMRNYGTAAALMVTFTLSGIWHGANWNFVLWGILHGVYLSMEVFYRPLQKKIHHALRIHKSRTLKIWQIFCTFHLVTFAWVFFRSSDLKQAESVLLRISSIFGEGLQGVFSGIRQVQHIIATSVSNTEYQLLLFSASIATLILLQTFGLQRLQRCKWPVRWGVYILLLGAIIMGRVPTHTDFIYFKF
jgi:D-alanyl-lipoteichoic acid acyltransferase DltB (MBOAT superfamily)